MSRIGVLKQKLFDNRLLANTFWLFFEQSFRLSATFLVSIWMIRYLGPEGYGAISYAQSIMTITVAIAGIGFDQSLVREYVKSTISRSVVLGTSFALRVVGSTVVLLVLSFGFFFSDQATWSMVMIVSLSTLFQASHVIAYLFQADMKSKYAALANIGGFVILTAIRIFLLVFEFPLIYFAVAIAADYAVNALFLWIFYKIEYHAIGTWKVDMRVCKSLLREGVPLILTGVSATAAMRMDQIILNSFLDTASVGIYAAGVRLAEVFTFIPIVIGNAVYPRIVALDRPESDRDLCLILRYTFIGLLALAVVLDFVATPIVTVLYGQDFAQCGQVVGILIWSVPLHFSLVLSTKLLMKERAGKIILSRQVYIAVMNFVFNLLLIPFYGMVGSALATIAALIAIHVIEYALPNTHAIFNTKFRIFMRTRRA